MVLGISVMSAGWHAFFYGIGTLLFILAAVIAWLVQPRVFWHAAVAAGLALVFFVSFWDALALT
jgi:hypothetical protein